MGNCCAARDKSYRAYPPSQAIKFKTYEDELKKQKAKVQEIIQKGQPWEDEEFPPQFKSLFDRSIDQGDRSKYQQFKWKRAKEIYPNAKLFSGGIDPNDINQGALGDCYLLATLSSMAENPEDIMAMFYNKTLNDAGIYLIYFWINGVKTGVIVDDYLPTQNGQMAFANGKDEELWVCLIEKAWAKIHGSYHRTEGGLPCFANTHLAGVPSESIMHDDDEFDLDEFWRTLQNSDKRHFTMMAASHGQGEAENDEGIIAGHAYSIISVAQFEHEGQNVRLLRLRNPWGASEWEGDWSDASELWTPELRKKLGAVQGDDGAFFIPLEDYVEQFAWTSVCVENAPEKYSRSNFFHKFELNAEKPQAFFSFNLKSKIDFNKQAFAISVLQQGQRLANYRLPNFGKFTESEFNIVLMTKQGKFVNARFGSRFMFSLLNDDIELEAGEYVFMVDPLWNESAGFEEDYTDVLLDVLAPVDTMIKEVDQA